MNDSARNAGMHTVATPSVALTSGLRAPSHSCSAAGLTGQSQRFAGRLEIVVTRPETNFTSSDERRRSQRGPDHGSSPALALRLSEAGAEIRIRLGPLGPSRVDLAPAAGGHAVLLRHPLADRLGDGLPGKGRAHQ